MSKRRPTLLLRLPTFLVCGFLLRNGVALTVMGAPQTDILGGDKVAYSAVEPKEITAGPEFGQALQVKRSWCMKNAAVDELASGQFPA